MCSLFVAGVAAADSDRTAAEVPQSCDIGLINGGFEQPDIHGLTPHVAQFGPDIKVYAQGVVPGWSNLGVLVELWRDGTVWDGLPPVPAYEGGQLAEFGGGYFQDVATVPGAVLTYRFAHRGRLGADTMRIMLGPVPAGGGTPAPAFSRDVTTDRTGWQVYTGTYTVPAGQTATRLQFQSVATATGNVGIGNFLDDVQLSQACTDFGDAPDSYGTTVADDGPRHAISGFTGADATPLMLGSALDIEDDGVPTAGADGDDARSLTDEDGVAVPIELSMGDAGTVTVSATNDTGADATLAGWIDLDGNGTFDPAERVVMTVPANAGMADYDLAFPAGTGVSDTYARFRLFPGVVSDPSPTGPADAGEVEDYPVAVFDRTLTIEKTSDRTADSTFGDTVTYTVTATNAGTADYTVRDPALVRDTLAGVLDDATYNNDALADLPGAVIYNQPVIRWQGALAAGDTATITYTVTLEPGGDLKVRNVAWAGSGTTPECEPPTAEGVDPVTGQPCDEDEFGVPDLQDHKTVDPKNGSIVVSGQTLSYTLTFTNHGTAPVRVDKVDNLSQVLDDATIVTVPASDNPALIASVINGGAFTIAGELAPGQTVTVTYTARVKAASNLGDAMLANYLLKPGEEPPTTCVTTEDATCNPVSDITATKTVDPKDGSSVDEGEELTYTLTFTNTGKGAGKVTYVDNMAGLLDDTTLTAEPTASNPGLSLAMAGDKLHITGTLAGGATTTVTYTVRVKDYADQGDHQLENFLNPTGVLGNHCVAGDLLCTRNPVARPADGNGSLPNTGAPAVLGLLGLGGFALIAGTALLTAGRRRIDAQTLRAEHRTR